MMAATACARPMPTSAARATAITSPRPCCRKNRTRRDRGASDPKPRVSLELQSLLPYPNSCLGASPHQQGRDTKMEMLSFGGIDVSKDRLDITVLPDEQCSSVSNDAAGWAELIEQLRGSLITPSGVEARARYERGVVRALLAAGMCEPHINPYKLRPCVMASGILATNPQLDSHMLASFVAFMP